jgi:hypothetical protein
MDSGEEVYEKLNSLSKLSLSDIKCRNSPIPWSDHIAWEGQGTPLLNCRMLGKRSEHEWAGTLVHERAHNTGYRHDGNNRTANECTVPYLAGDIAEWIAHNKAGKAWRPRSCICTRAASAIKPRLSNLDKITFCE